MDVEIGSLIEGDTLIRSLRASHPGLRRVPSKRVKFNFFILLLLFLVK